MPRPAHPWYRSSRAMWYATVGGKKTSLGIPDPNDEAAAWEAFQVLLRAAREAPDGRPPAQTVGAMVAAFLADAAQRVKPRTLKGYQWYAGLFASRFGPQPADSLTAKILETDGRRAGWSSSTRNNYLSTAVTVLTWAGIKLDRPVKKPRKESAGMKSLIAEDTYRRMLAITRGDWRGVIVFLWETGCRPSEAAAVELPFVSFAGGVVVLKDHKTAGETNADRVIYLSGEAAAVLRRQAEKYGAGLLFRSQRRGGFSAQAFVMKFQRLSAKLGEHVTAYGFRHTFCTRLLAAGVPDAHVAALVGHASTTMLHRHYSHLSSLGRVLRDALGKLKPGGEAA